MRKMLTGAAAKADDFFKGENFKAAEQAFIDAGYIFSDRQIIAAYLFGMINAYVTNGATHEQV